MKRLTGIIGTIVSIIAVAPIPVRADPPPPAPAPKQLHIEALTPPASPFVTDEQIGEAITKGAKFLAGRFANSTLVEGDQFSPAAGAAYRRDRLAGADALAVYALVQCGLAINQPDYSPDGKFMKGLIDTMKSLQSTRFNTYSRGIRATALAALNRPEDRGALKEDVQNLLDACSSGSYDYVMPSDGVGSSRNHAYATRRPSHWDNSNSQYGLLGVWSAAEIGAEIPADYWEAVEHYWTACQCENGQWPYISQWGQSGKEGALTMTLAGLASMFVCHDYIDVARFGTDVGREPFSPPVVKGLAWLEAADNCIPPWDHKADGYCYYGLERVGLASGFKYFGKHDWYRELATQVVHAQLPDGSWPDGTYFLGVELNTSYMLLFLSRGRHPILMNKLRFEHFWANRPRDVAHLATFAGKELEHVFNWQVVNLEHDWSDWLDCPVLYLASHAAPKLEDADYAKIRDFVNAGGMLFTQADGGSPEFNAYVEKVLRAKVFPDFEMTKLPPDHPIYSVYVAMKEKPPLQAVSNGARILWVHSPADLGQWWQQRASRSHTTAFQLGLNLFVYAAGKRDFQNRIATSYIPQPPETPAPQTIRVARVKYPLPTWDPEPYAWTRLSHYVQWHTSVKIEPQSVEMEKLGDLSPADVPLAHLTGTLPYTATEAQLQGLRKYVDAGGILFIDACGGGGFNESVKAMLAKAFDNPLQRPLALASPLLSPTSPGMSDLKVSPTRQYVKSLNDRPAGFITFTSGKGQVIYSPMDITNGLLGSQTWGISGYTAPYCLDFMKNLVLWSAQGARP